MVGFFCNMLTHLENKIKALQKFSFKDEVERIVSANEGKLTVLQTEQMLSGKDRNGDWIRPFYSENAYFKSKDAAYKYAKWKSKISPNKSKPFDVPDLFIVGYYHGTIKTNVQGDKFTIGGVGSFADKVENTHKEALGLNIDSRKDFIMEVTRPQIHEVYKRKVTNI